MKGFIQSVEKSQVPTQDFNRRREFCRVRVANHGANVSAGGGQLRDNFSADISRASDDEDSIHADDEILEHVRPLAQLFDRSVGVLPSASPQTTTANSRAARSRSWQRLPSKSNPVQTDGRTNRRIVCLDSPTLIWFTFWRC